MKHYNVADDLTTIIVFTGKGGVGKTTCAASTALYLSELGINTLVISTDPAHSLGDCFERKLENIPKQIIPNLWAMEINALSETRKRIDGIRQTMVKQMQSHGLNEMVAEEMVAFPGSEELFCLLKIIELKDTGQYKVIVVDTAPTGNTMRFLHFPEFLSPMRRALKVDRLYSRAIRPFASLLKYNVPEDNFYSSIFSLFTEVERARDHILRGKTYFRFVLIPEKLALLETQRAVSFLNISGYTVDAIIVNKILPNSVKDSFFQTWKQIQQQYIDETKVSFYPLNILDVPLYEKEILGIDMLRTLAKELYNGQNPLSRLTSRDMFVLERKDSEVLLNIQVPYKERSELKLYKQGQELIINVGPYEQRVQLPAFLLDYDLKLARYEENYLLVSFAKKQI